MGSRPLSTAAGSPASRLVYEVLEGTLSAMKMMMVAI